MAGKPEQTFGEYYLVEQIAVGGMAEVWKARSYGLAGFERTLVIKKILDELAREEEFVRLFVDEAHISVSLQHGNIVQVFDLGNHEGSLYMAMEYVAGVDLGKLINLVKAVEPFPIHYALFIASEVLKALRFAHNARGEGGDPLNIVHCDISPQNILISHAGEVKITDFGISRAAFQAASLHDTVRGKYAYMSPEQIENQPLDARSDLFSLGIVLWEVLTGRRLFKGKNRDETLQRVKRAEVPSPRDYRPAISEDLEGILLKALARNPAQRFSSAAEMLDAIANLMNREGHRATNHDIAQYLQIVGAEGSTGQRVAARPTQRRVLVVAAEVLPGPDERVLGAEAARGLLDAWVDALTGAGAELWEREARSLLAVWPLEGGLDSLPPGVLDAVVSLRALAADVGAGAAVGVAPGDARIFTDTRRPARGWELAGPFYLARWLMNLSAWQDAVVLTAAAGEALSVASRDGAVVGRLALDDGKAVQLLGVR